ncbi:Bifunctional purine biosynthetic protein ADE5,7 [Amphichorda felina]
MADSPCRILVMASGNGSNFQALCDGISDGRIPDASIIRLIVNRGKAYATTRAESKGIPWEYFNLISHGFQEKGEKDPQKVQDARDRYDAALAAKILEHQPHLVVLAGWMQIFGEHFLDPLTAKGIRVINLHPALPRAYDGANAIERAFEDFQNGKLKDNKTGIMVHNVIKEVDQGEPILTKEIECRQGETLAQLEERIHSHEHELIVQATAKVVGEILGKSN